MPVVTTRWRSSLAHSVAARTALEPEVAAVAAQAAGAGSLPEPIVLAYALAVAADVGARAMRRRPSCSAHAVVGRGADLGIAGPYVARVAARHGLTALPAAASALVEQLTARRPRCATWPP
ncbi:MAG: hypothetical protein R2755_28875 [Acidimicrobiales bacterium]